MLILMGTLFSSDVFAQDPHFTQFYANPLYLNPAFAGSARCPRFILNYRNQWPAITGTYVTTSASYDQHIDAISGGLGLLVMHDEAGVATINTTNFSAIYSYQLNVTREFSMKFGFEAMYKQKGVDRNKLTFGDMIDAKRGFVYNTQDLINPGQSNVLDISAGILGYSKRYYAGFAVHHLTQPNESLMGQVSKLPMKYTAHAGAVIEMDYESTISPNVMWMMQQDFKELLLGLYVTRGPIVGGLWFRGQKDAFIALIGLQQGIIKMGYSYDITVSKLANATAGSHELSFQMVFECRPKKKKFRTVSCPSF